MFWVASSFFPQPAICTHIMLYKGSYDICCPFILLISILGYNYMSRAHLAGNVSQQSNHTELLKEHFPLSQKPTVTFVTSWFFLPGNLRKFLICHIHMICQEEFPMNNFSSHSTDYALAKHDYKLSAVAHVQKMSHLLKYWDLIFFQKVKVSDMSSGPNINKTLPWRSTGSHKSNEKQFALLFACCSHLLEHSRYLFIPTGKGQEQVYTSQ